MITDDLSNVDLDEFKDIDSNEEKLFGTELFDELPPEERQEKLNEVAMCTHTHSSELGFFNQKSQIDLCCFSEKPNQI